MPTYDHRFVQRMVALPVFCFLKNSRGEDILLSMQEPGTDAMLYQSISLNIIGSILPVGLEPTTYGS